MDEEGVGKNLPEKSDAGPPGDLHRQSVPLPCRNLLEGRTRPRGHRRGDVSRSEVAERPAETGTTGIPHFVTFGGINTPGTRPCDGEAGQVHERSRQSRPVRKTIRQGCQPRYRRVLTKNTMEDGRPGSPGAENEDGPVEFHGEVTVSPCETKIESISIAAPDESKLMGTKSAGEKPELMKHSRDSENVGAPS